MTHRHLRVFVSSRMAELAEERRIVREVLKDMAAHGFVYEVDAGARPDSAQSTYLGEIEQSDLYLGLFGFGYGSYTIEEYEHARRLALRASSTRSGAGSARAIRGCRSSWTGSGVSPPARRSPGSRRRNSWAHSSRAT